ncbi:putative major allergen Mal f 1 precursor [Testicularia cyperi]|uniref:Putative major allergen Mal f 1 n=1 Tax=Testicularia cyperi TaxID=1882483 RepID=A0A317XMS3_9BASI|nr:putative major allergen Mal f 1 precursor [Testicularia cyperi]
MKLTWATALAAVALSFSSDIVSALPVSIESRAAAPDVYNVNVKNLYPEDTVLDKSRGLLYQSNLWKGRISVWNTANSNHFNLLIPGVSSDGSGSQQMAGLSINGAGDKLFAVAKDSGAFRFGSTQSKNGPSSFHRFDLPVNANSAPRWSVNLNGVQTAFAKSTGTRPFGPVDSAQDGQDNSYVVFALGRPAIAKISADGQTVTPWYSEASNGSERPGYTGIQYIPSANVLVAYGGPRPLTMFDLSQPNPVAVPVKITGGSFGSLTVTEKLTLVNRNGRNILFGTKAPTVYSFTSTDNWRTAAMKTYTRNEFKSNSLTVVTEGNFNGGQQVYGGGAYFGEGARGGRTQFPLYRIYNMLT